MSGQAFTPFICAGPCGQEHFHHNTSVPKLCDSCADAAGACVRCGHEREWAPERGATSLGAKKKKTMTYDDISETMRAYLGAFEGFRKMGFRAEDIYCTIAKSVLAGGATSCFVTLRAQRRIFNLEVGVVEDQKAFQKEWDAVCEAVNSKRVSQEDLDRIWQESLPCRKKVEFLTALVSKGFKIPKTMS